jgi:hypothetical protein
MNEETLKNKKSGGKPAFPTCEITFVDSNALRWKALQPEIEGLD